MKRDITADEKYGPAMKIQEQPAADAYFEECVQHDMGFGIKREDAEKMERGNLGYYAGYYSDATRERVERLFRCSHPIFGSIAQEGPVMPEDAFAAGLKATDGPRA